MGSKIKFVEIIKVEKLSEDTHKSKHMLRDVSADMLFVLLQTSLLSSV